MGSPPGYRQKEKGELVNWEGGKVGMPNRGLEARAQARMQNLC